MVCGVGGVFGGRRWIEENGLQKQRKSEATNCAMEGVTGERMGGEVEERGRKTSVRVNKEEKREKGRKRGMR